MILNAIQKNRATPSWAKKVPRRITWSRSEKLFQFSSKIQERDMSFDK